MGGSLLTAISLVLVIEGAMPLLAPALWRETFRRVLQLSDGQIRFVGLASTTIGLALLLLLGR